MPNVMKLRSAFALPFLILICPTLYAGDAVEENVSADSISLTPPYVVSLGGQYRVMSTAANFGWHAASISDDESSMSGANQRLRTWLNLHDSKTRMHGAYLQLEVGHDVWGDDREGPKTHGANGDEVGVELRRGFLWYKPNDDSLVRVGVVDWHDRFGERPAFSDHLRSVDAYDSFGAVLANSIWDFNVGGVTYEGRHGEDWYCRAGALMLGTGRTFTSSSAAVLIAADIDKKVGEHLFGASLYYLNDQGDYSYGLFGGPGAAYEKSTDLWFGARAHMKLGEADTSFFVILNQGETENPDWEHSGIAVKAAVSMKTPIGKLRAQALYSTGNDGSSATESDEFRTIAQSERDNFGAQGYWSLLALTSPRGPADVNDLGVGVQNRGLGLITLQAGLERNLHESLAGYVGLGLLQSAEDNPTNGESDIGIEIVADVHWSLQGALGLDVGAAYLMTGDFYKTSAGAPDPEDLFQIYARLQLEF